MSILFDFHICIRHALIQTAFVFCQMSRFEPFPLTLVFLTIHKSMIHANSLASVQFAQGPFPLSLRQEISVRICCRQQTLISIPIIQYLAQVQLFTLN